jgi:glutathione peroxidase-family protein
MASASTGGSPTIYEFSADDIDGTKQSMEKYRGQVVYIVNVASK